ncbi:MAG: hypothetical protein AB1942_21685 [Pseudomonadota bacterium]
MEQLELLQRLYWLLGRTDAMGEIAALLARDHDALLELIGGIARDSKGADARPADMMARILAGLAGLRADLLHRIGDLKDEALVEARLVAQESGVDLEES